MIGHCGNDSHQNFMGRSEARIVSFQARNLSKTSEINQIQLKAMEVGNQAVDDLE